MSAHHPPTRAFRRVTSPLGDLFLVGSDLGLHALIFAEPWNEAFVRFGAPVEADLAVLTDAARQLSEYFGGTRRTFDLPLVLDGTPFQRRAWLALADIPYGETRTYGQQAALLGAREAVRAVGRANGLNPVCVILPCHRVIGADGALTGYAGGLAAKRTLLDLEAVSAGRTLV